ncbi:hypothetical protein [Thiothrix winogradskyi]|uniref:Uncharacterized protein n=1 Tax=Thiothrix winogradskyi TaxID=96472 RepID=A0ABY3SZ14_9GAMM|nr:hypothetical protein [Thiothrix winogradskyi]UJS23990.1 hypothetical protein L2Y54_18945 [Thiothrix winogradskyi]
MSQASTVIDTAPHELDILTQAEYQERQADQLMREVFGSEARAGATGDLITRFITSYEQHKNDMPLEQWLVKALNHFPDLWQDRSEAEVTARSIITSVERNNAAMVSLHEHLEKGKSRASWIAKRIEESAKEAGITDVAAYAAEIHEGLRQADQHTAESLADNNEAVKTFLQFAGNERVAATWNDVSRIDYAQLLDKDARRNATLNAAKQGARILGERSWNWITGRKNPSVSEDMQRFFESSLHSAKHVGVQVAVSGGMVVAVKKGLVEGVLKNTPIAPLVDMVTMGMSKAKVLYKFAKGELTAADALEAVAGNVIATVASNVATVIATKGAREPLKTH